MTTEINNMPSGNDSSASTVLISVVVVLLIGLAIWFFGFRGASVPAANNGGTNIEVNLPTGGAGGAQGGASGGAQ